VIFVNGVLLPVALALPFLSGSDCVAVSLVSKQLGHAPFYGRLGAMCMAHVAGSDGCFPAGCQSVVARV